MKRKSKISENGARIIVSLLGFLFLLWNANNIGLYLFGDTAPAYDIQISRIGNREDTSVGREYRFSVSYSYTADGTEYKGTNTGVRGPRLGPRYDKTVHYYPFAPQISSLYAEDAAKTGTFLACGLGLALILIGAIPRKKGENIMRMENDHGQAPVPGDRITMAWLMEHADGYDDSLEEYYQNGWDEDDPSWQCYCGKWNTENFCEYCGKTRRR